ncbi:hypothetical protein GCM10028803_45650 [Larkinella knui]|uniref:ImmA/IrrE family metallo-endopeptidase n=1 Tax=Larkinella knui TaxID=2025310 RepID=A0A3P1CQ23_9BACT|nr:ImmA/IrrE family metallo-endopeptidase [Larkinella knui]RRB15166.1 ImmA/IrrE family metallo-endopeptidase [Larkinella knui]
MKAIEFNVKRLDHLMTQFRVSKNELLSKISEKLKKPITEKDVFRGRIKLGTLKKIDKIFNKGLEYYTDPSDPIESKSESIFFRKDIFNADLNLGAKRLVNKFEEDKLFFLALNRMIDYKVDRKLPVFKINEKARNVADKVREFLNPEHAFDAKQFLQNFIDQLAENNILVFEFIEHPGTKERANIKGMFLAPNVIALNRNKDSRKQEIFTLAHELGHYLLNQEEIDDNIIVRASNYNAGNAIERWCSDFAYYFLAGKYSEIIDELGQANPENDFHHDIIEDIGIATQLSKASIYTRLLLNDKIDAGYYNKVIATLDKQWLESKIQRDKASKAKLEEEKRKAEAEGRTFFLPPPKPIISPLYKRTLKGALYNGLITERDFCKRLYLSSKNLDSYLQI